MRLFQIKKLLHNKGYNQQSKDRIDEIGKISDKGFISRIYKEILKIHNKILKQLRPGQEA